MTHYLIIAALFLTNTLAWGEDATTTTTAPETAVVATSSSADVESERLGLNAIDPDRWSSRVGLFVDFYPLPLLYAGYGLGAEVLVKEWLSVTAAYKLQRFDGENDTYIVGTDLNAFNTSTKNNYFGMRLYNGLTSSGWRGLYVSAGYKWTKANVNYTPQYIRAPGANMQSNDDGVYAGVGYRISSPYKKSAFIMDFSVQYEPGYVSDVLARFSNSGGTSSTRVSYNLENGIRPDIKIGYRF